MKSDFLQMCFVCQQAVFFLSTRCVYVSKGVSPYPYRCKNKKQKTPPHDLAQDTIKLEHMSMIFIIMLVSVVPYFDTPMNPMNEWERTNLGRRRDEINFFLTPRIFSLHQVFSFLLHSSGPELIETSGRKDINDRCGRGRRKKRQFVLSNPSNAHWQCSWSSQFPFLLCT